MPQKRGIESPNYGRKLSDFAKQKITEANKNRIWSAESKTKLSASYSN